MSEFEDDRIIDIHNLHLECQKQAQLCGKWGDKFAKAKGERFLAEENLKIVKAEVKRTIDEKRAYWDSYIRGAWDGEGFEKKPTEAAITGWINQYDSFKDEVIEQEKLITEAVKKTAEAIEYEAKMESGKVSMNHKKSGIEGLIQLWLNEYFADPKIPKSLVEIQEKEYQQKHRKHLNRKEK